MRSDREEAISAAEWSPNPTCTWTPSRTRTTARPWTPSAWTALTAWRQASLPAPQTTSRGQRTYSHKPAWESNHSKYLLANQGLVEEFSERRDGITVRVSL